MVFNTAFKELILTQYTTNHTPSSHYIVVSRLGLGEELILDVVLGEDGVRTLS